MEISPAEFALSYYSPGEPDECWHWQNVGKNGYGTFPKYGNWRGWAHRVMYELANGPVPKGMHVDHTCHNESVCVGGRSCPHRACVNPRHLEAVTPSVNVARGAAARARANPSCPNGHSAAEMGRDGRGWRACEACARERSAQVRAEMKAGVRPIKTGTCEGCGSAGKIMARGLCNACYLRQYRAAKRAS